MDLTQQIVMWCVTGIVCDEVTPRLLTPRGDEAGIAFALIIVGALCFCLAIVIAATSRK